MAQMFDPNFHFDARLAEAAELLEEDPKDLVSLKVRPTRQTDRFSDGNGHVYPDEYEKIH